MNTTYNEIFKHVHSKKTKADLIPISEMLDSLDEKQVQHITKFINETGLKWSNFYYNENITKPYVYYNPPYYFGFFALDGNSKDIFEHERKFFYRALKEIDKVLLEKNYSMYFHYVEGPYDLLLFAELFDKLKGQDKYDVLIDLYVSSEYGHSQITREMWEDAIAERIHLTNDVLPLEQEVFTIYRGEASESTNLSEAMSWSLNSSVASRFLSYSNGMGANIYKAKVNRNDIIDYLDNRNEAEIICFPEDVYDIETIEQLDPIELYTTLNINRIIDEYVYYRNTILVNIEGFEQGTHNQLHSVRVLLLALSLGYLLDVTDRDRAILANAAMYHDSARDNDGVDTIHGERAIEKMEKKKERLLSITCKDVDIEYELGSLNEEEKKIAYFIIKWHCIDDEKVAKQLDKMDDKERVKKLFNIFKDADALDRIRLRDLDINYLRTDKAKQMVGYAHFLFNSVRQQNE